MCARFPVEIQNNDGDVSHRLSNTWHNSKEGMYLYCNFTFTSSSACPFSHLLCTSPNSYIQLTDIL